LQRVTPMNVLFLEKRETTKENKQTVFEKKREELL
jgi:hypothetical protein